MIQTSHSGNIHVSCILIISEQEGISLHFIPKKLILILRFQIPFEDALSIFAILLCIVEIE